jgi:hypothetical protein
MIEVRRSCRSGVPRTAWRTGRGSAARRASFAGVVAYPERSAYRFDLVAAGVSGDLAYIVGFEHILGPRPTDTALKII